MLRALCPRHPHKTARGRCADCGQAFCARCEYRTNHRLFCGPACAADHQRKRAGRRGPKRSLAVPLLAASAAAGAFVAARLIPNRPSRPPATPPPAAASIPTPLFVPAAVPPPALFESSHDRLKSPSILISFDAGSSDRGASEILDALRGRGIRTTIFLTGQFIRRYPDLTRRIAHDGHEVGNHTFDHPHLTTYAIDGRQRTRAVVTEEVIRRELEMTAALYRETTGRSMAGLWRAPFGEENKEIRQWAARAGFVHVSWTHGSGRNLDALDWVTDPESPRYRASEGVISRLLAFARPGSIILMHLGSDRGDPVADHLPRLLDTLSSEGYRFSTASELIASEAASR